MGLSLTPSFLPSFHMDSDLYFAKNVAFILLDQVWLVQDSLLQCRRLDRSFLFLSVFLGTLFDNQVVSIFVARLRSLLPEEE